MRESDTEGEEREDYNTTSGTTQTLLTGCETTDALVSGAETTLIAGEVNQ